MTEPPPGRFSTTTCCPSRLENAPAITRAAASLPPPGASGTMRRIVRSGYGCAEAAGAMKAAARMIAAAPTRMLSLDGTRPSSVHVDRNSRDHAGPPGGEEHGEIGVVLRLHHASQRHVLDELLLRFRGRDAVLARADRDQL